MKKYVCLLLVLTVLPLIGSNVWLKQNFENKKFFSLQKIVNAPGWRIAHAPYARIAIDPSSKYNQVLRMTRNDKLSFFFCQSSIPIPKGYDFTVSFDCFIGKKGRVAVSLINTQKQRIGGIMLRHNSQLAFLGKCDAWGPSQESTPQNWFRVELEFKSNEGFYQPKLILSDGSEIIPPKQKILHDGQLASIRMNTMPPENSTELIDNILVTYAEKRSVANRIETLSGVTPNEVKGIKDIDKLFDNNDSSSAVLTKSKATLSIIPKKRLVVSTLFLRASPGIMLSAIGWNPGGQRIELAEKQIVPTKEGILQIDFNPTELSRLDLSFSGKQKQCLSTLELYSDKIINQGTEDMAFIKRVYGEFRLPVWERQKNAELHLFNTVGKKYPVTIELAERYSKRKVIPAFIRILKPGKNIIKFKLDNLPEGSFIATVTDGMENSKPRGAFRRLLRHQIPVKMRLSNVPDLTGESMYFPDDHYLEKHEKLSFVPGVADLHRVTRGELIPGLNNHIGKAIGFKNGKLSVQFLVMDYHYNLATKREFSASAIDDSLEKWQFSALNGKLPKFKGGQSVFGGECVSANRPKKDQNGKIKYRFYDPVRDGKVDVKQVEIKYITFIPKGEYGGQPEAVWEKGFKPPKRTTWAIWHKQPGLSLVLSREPMLTDDRAAGDFESEKDTNDNFCGQWLSDDGKTLFYARGRVLRMNPPYNVSYDNLVHGFRMITIFSSTDGINFKRSFAALPGIKEPYGTQHYGGCIRRLLHGNGLRVGFIMHYLAYEQRYCYMLAYSWDGLHWERFYGYPLFIDNGSPRSWSCGLLSISGNPVERNGKLFFLMTRVRNIYHFGGVMRAAYRKRKSITGEITKKYLSKLGIEKWPYFNRFKDYEDLGTFIWSARSDIGVAELRNDGFFALTAGNEPGSFISYPVRAGKSLSINCQVGKGGYLKLSVIDEQGKKVLSREFKELDALDQKVFEQLPSGAFRIRGELKNAKLYTLNFN